ncbi:MAG: hypothetical protein J6Y85_02245 [Alphaproteobacteria bacterium]|nr:hypothetical protein [Alphaproteobacteria bacterium]
MNIKIAFATLICGSILCATPTFAASCAKKQWLNVNKCAACPVNATCDGKTFKCDPNFISIGKNVFVQPLSG